MLLKRSTRDDILRNWHGYDELLIAMAFKFSNPVVMRGPSNNKSPKSTKLYPSWLQDNPKQLPGIYQGVLGQVQLQPEIGTNLVIKSKQADYMNRFTDTERVHQLLSASQLSNESLATIWAHVNKTFPGKLTNREVCLALALIAIFQHNEREQQKAISTKSDPFVLVGLEQKPPVPILYPCSRPKQVAKAFPISKSSEGLTSSNLLVDLSEDTDKIPSRMKTRDDAPVSTLDLTHNQHMNSISLIDIDGYKFEIEFSRLTQTWNKFMIAMRRVFKRSFDILNVENSRSSALEALRSGDGMQFGKQLCLCYPLAHNIKQKINELNNLTLFPPGKDSENNEHKQNGLFDKSYLAKMDDLMNSINEYWAVLINLLHESGQTSLIELVMDGLNYKKKTVTSRTLEELLNELDGSNKPEVCSICHTPFYLIREDISGEDADLLMDVKPISVDSQYYYHPKCANFWLSHVDRDALPFCKQPDLSDDILRPTKG